MEVTGIYSRDDLMSKLFNSRGSRVPKSTLSYWLSSLNMVPADNGLYTQEDLEILKSLIRWLKCSKKISVFKEKLDNASQTRG